MNSTLNIGKNSALASPAARQTDKATSFFMSMSDTSQARDFTPQERPSKRGVSLIENAQSACFNQYLGRR